jgi:outer membrane protein insertion porin family
MALKAATQDRLFFIILTAFALMLFSSCATNFPANKPFVYENSISLPKNFSRNEQKELEPLLLQQLHDSIRVRKTSKFLFFTKREITPVYDSINADKSLVFISSFLNSLGYYRDSVRYDTTMKVVDNQYRTTVNFYIENAQLFRFDSIGYNLLQDTVEGPLRNSASRQKLQEITNNAMRQSEVRKGEPFSQAVLAQEINRLSEEYKNNGFLKFSSEEFIVLWDTVGLALIRPTLDPLEQAAQLEELRRRRANPTVDIEFRLRSNDDTSRLIQYHVGNVNIYPDLTADTSDYYPTIDTIGGYRFVSYKNLFKPRKLTEYVFLNRGDLYRNSNVLKTQNRFSGLNSWRSVVVLPVPRPGVDTVDFEIKMTPASRYLLTANLEGSRNLTQLVSTGNLLGVGANISILNRNFLRAANQFTNNFRYGVELNVSSRTNVVQTQQLSYSGSVQFPRAIPAAAQNFFGKEKIVRTILAANVAYTDRLNFFTVGTFNTSWGYEVSWKNRLLNVRFPNIEYNSLQRGPRLEELIQTNRSFAYLFNRGLILSVIGNYNWATGSRSTTNLFSISGELAGVPWSLIPSRFLDTNLYRFGKVDFQYTRTNKFRRSAFAFRLFAGFGYPFAKNVQDTFNRYLPFFRQYIAGGPNSMRAWGIRRLGPGSSVVSFGRNVEPDRFGDVRFETNAEYRFYLANISGVTLNGAAFIDVGNVWFLRENPDFPNGNIQLDRFLTDLAIGTGTGLRIDFSFLKLRFDYAFKVKDPAPANPDEQNKWFYKWQLLGGQLQFGIDYPF